MSGSCPKGYKLYKPNHEKWYRFYKLQAEGKLNAFNHVQRGGQRASMISVDAALDLYDPGWREAGEKKEKENNGNDVKFNMVTPVEQVVEQAKAQQKKLKNGSQHPTPPNGRPRRNYKHLF